MIFLLNFSYEIQVIIFFYKELANSHAARPVIHWSDQQPSVLGGSITGPGFKTLCEININSDFFLGKKKGKKSATEGKKTNNFRKESH